LLELGLMVWAELVRFRRARGRKWTATAPSARDANDDDNERKYGDDDEQEKHSWLGLRGPSKI